MNISSLVVYLKDQSLAQNLIAEISKIEGCEVAANQNDKIVVTIESEELDYEIKVFKNIQAMQGVRDVSMIYTYQDLDDDIEAVNNNNLENIMLEIDSKDAKDIEYSGHLKI